MFKKIEAKLIEGFNVKTNPFIYRRLILTSTLLFLMFFVFSVFFFINLSRNAFHLMIMDSVVILISVTSLYLLFIKKKITVSATCASVMLTIFLILFSYLGKNNNFGLVWTLLYPVFVIPILGEKQGLRLVSLFYIVLLPIVYNGIGTWDNGYWDLTAFIRFFIASLTIIYTTYFFESTSVSAYKTIMKIREKEKIYLITLEGLSTTDQLTGLHNRRYFDNHLKIESQKVKRYASHLCLIIIDIDHFKSINDQYGHQVGDSVLIEFSSLLKNIIRETDILSRWGGEEFIILLPETTLESSLLIAEKIRLAISNHSFQDIGNLTASFGVSEINPNSITNREAIHAADKALYTAKKQGRNLVVSANS